MHLLMCIFGHYIFLTSSYSLSQIIIRSLWCLALRALGSSVVLTEHPPFSQRCACVGSSLSHRAVYIFPMKCLLHLTYCFFIQSVLLENLLLPIFLFACAVTWSQRSLWFVRFLYRHHSYAYVYLPSSVILFLRYR